MAQQSLTEHSAVEFSKAGKAQPSIAVFSLAHLSQANRTKAGSAKPNGAQRSVALTTAPSTIHVDGATLLLGAYFQANH